MRITNTEYFSIISMLKNKQNNMLVISWIMTAIFTLSLTSSLVFLQTKEVNIIPFFVLAGLAFIGNITFLRLSIKTDKLGSQFKKQAKEGLDIETIKKNLELS